ncbi:hypothetical protein [Streptomyces sp. NPDC001054]
MESTGALLLHPRQHRHHRRLPQDARTDREGGARVVGGASGATAAEALDDAEADHVIDDLTDLGRLLELIR